VGTGFYVFNVPAASKDKSTEENRKDRIDPQGHHEG
jgi:hypothetical protein